MRRLFAILPAVLLLSWSQPHPAQAGKVYKWTDADGKVHFSDNPAGGTNPEEVKIRTFTGSSEVVLEAEGYGPRSVKILSTTWCGVCKKARDYLAAKGIYFSEYDVENSEIGRQEYKRLNGKGVPVILVGNQRMDGFSAAKLDVMLKNVGYF